MEMQTSKPLLPDEVRRIINDMETEFLSRRKILISGLPPNWTSIDAVSYLLGVCMHAYIMLIAVSLL